MTIMSVYSVFQCYIEEEKMIIRGTYSDFVWGKLGCCFALLMTRKCAYCFLGGEGQTKLWLKSSDATYIQCYSILSEDKMLFLLLLL